MWNGISLLERTARTALEVTSRVLVIGRSRPSGWPLEDVLFVADETPHLGPMGGLQTALRHAATVPTHNVLALACDLPKMTPDGLRWLFDAASQHQLDHGLVVLNAGQLEPLFSIYTLSCLPLIESLLAAHRRSLHGLIQAGQFERIAAPAEIGPMLVNVNTPEDVERLQGEVV
ncbi:MAG: molybdenum cofactor guanylyltransferase [Armatimonadota bacterium]|nr:molybdenum cofactor guanylyltransferase [Armatimonadota bacterium]